MRIFIICSNPPYGNETTRSALRIARRLLKEPDVQLSMFLMAESVYCAVKKAEYANGSYGELASQTYSAPQLVSLLLEKATVYACGTCMGERSLSDDDMLEGIQKGTMDILNEESVSADQVMCF